MEHKMIKKIILAACLLGITAFPAVAQKPEDSKVVAYYFHGVMRCPTCHKLEQYSKEVIENNFKSELASGKLEFKAINVEVKGNEHFVDDYQLYTKSLVLSLVKSGKEVRSKNLAAIWELVGNKDKFNGYVKEEVTGFLKGQ
jgi:hypothetical protein